MRKPVRPISRQFVLVSSLVNFWAEPESSSRFRVATEPFFPKLAAARTECTPRATGRDSGPCCSLTIPTCGNRPGDQTAQGVEPLHSRSLVAVGV